MTFSCAVLALEQAGNERAEPVTCYEGLAIIRQGREGKDGHNSVQDG